MNFTFRWLQTRGQYQQVLTQMGKFRNEEGGDQRNQKIRVQLGLRKLLEIY